MYWQENIEFWPPFTFFVVLLVMNDKVVFVSVKKRRKNIYFHEIFKKYLFKKYKTFENVFRILASNRK